MRLYRLLRERLRLLKKVVPMKLRLFLWSVVSALAGFLFGFDTVVISGAEQSIQKLWSLDPFWHGIVTGSALYGTVLGSIIGGWITDRFGRRPVLLWIGLLYVVSAIGCGFAPNASFFIIARFLGGLGIGVSTVVAPLYISEIAPPAYRGRLAGMFQFNIVFGIVIAFVSNLLLKDMFAENVGWRWMIGIAAIPSVIYAVLCMWIPESPRWLLTRKGDRAKGIAVLKLIEPDSTDAQITAQADEIIAASASSSKTSETLWTWRLKTPILLAFLIAFFNQLSGINAILYFAPRIFEWTGMGDKAAMLQSVGIGVTNLIFTFVGLALIDKLGRRTLLYIGSFGYIASLGLTAWAFFSQHYSIVPACIFAFIAAHAIGQGTVIWVFISEIFPNRQRAEGQTLGSATHWVFAAALTTVFPIVVGMIEKLTWAKDKTGMPLMDDKGSHVVASNSPYGYIFLFFCFMMVLQLIWVKFMVPETKGRSLEEIQQDLHIS